MSFNNPGSGSGQYASYTPPTPSLEPPGRRPKSPWLYVSLGCGFLVLLLFGGCVGAGVLFTNKIKQEMAQPVNEAQVLHELGDTPIYPGATLDKKTTQAARGAMIALRMVMSAKGQQGGAAGFATPDAFLKVLTWYDEKLRAMGYKPGKEQGNNYTYIKGSEIIVLQSMSHASNPDGGTQFMIIRFTAPASKTD